MLVDEVQETLVIAFEERLDSADVLSRLLSILFRWRMQPMDPDYVTSQGCRSLMCQRPDIALLVNEAVRKKDCDLIVSSDLLRFEDTVLRSYRPQILADHAVDRVIEEFIRDFQNILLQYANSAICLPIFLNGAGTGKTRLLLEGLSRNWGLYLPALMESVSPGSFDLQEAISAGLHSMQWTKKATGLAIAAVVARNIHLARRVFLQVLLARLTVFQIFLDSAPYPNDTDARIRWLALQLAPVPLVKRDIFKLLSVRISVLDCSLPYLEGRIADTLLKIRSKVGVDEPIFCVVDDVQDPCDTYPEHFGSSSALREMAWAWGRHEGLTLILAGRPSGMPLDHVDALGYDFCTDTGSFDDPNEQSNYVRRYLPPQLTSSKCGEMLLRRICLWLRGRYRITTLFVHCLLAAGYRYPHTLLDTYVGVYAKVEPADGPRRTSAAAREESSFVVGTIGRYDPAQILSQDLQAWSSAQTALNRILTLGQDAVHFAEDCVHLVSLEFARFTQPDASEVVVNEPLFVFPVADVLFHRWGPTYGFLSSSAASGLRHQPVHKSFHIAAVPLLLLALQGHMRLCDIFSFPDPAPQWAEQVCKLVRLTRPVNGRELRAIPYTTSFPAQISEGPWAIESPEWLENLAPEPFCIAPDFSHADLLFAVQLTDGRAFYVALTILLKNRFVDVPVDSIQRVLENLDTARLFNDALDSSTCPTLDLTTPLEGSGAPSVLRVFATFPDATDIRILRHDSSSQLMATLKMNVLQKLSESILYDSILSRVEAALIRRRNDRIFGDAPISFEAEE
ncbi:hypothetical protein EV121DRAFT_212522 [Schizophyllum commune]